MTMLNHISLDPTHLRRTFGAFASGITVIAGLDDRGEPLGLLANSFTSVSLAPALALVCIHHGSGTWPRLHRLPRLGISILAADQEWLARQVSTRRESRLAGVGWSQVDSAVLIDDSHAWIEASVRRQISAGDHDIVLLEIHDLQADFEREPLVFHASSYRKLG